MNDVLNAGIAGALNMAGNIYSSKMSEKRQDNQNAFQDYLLQRTNDLNVENWNAQNAYNTDSNQVARRKAAGLNPVSIDGGSNAEGISAASAPGVGAPASVPDFGRISQDVLNAMNLDNQRKLIESQVNKNNAEADATRGVTGPASLAMDVQRSVKDLNDATTALRDSERLNTDSQRKLVDINSRIADIERSLSDLRLQRETAVSTVYFNGTPRKLAYYMADAFLKFQKVQESIYSLHDYKYRRQSLAANASLDIQRAATFDQSFKATIQSVYSQISKTSAEIGNINASTEKVKSETFMQQFENDLRHYLGGWERYSKLQDYMYETQKSYNMLFEERLGLSGFKRVNPFSFGSSQLSVSK